MVSWILYVFVLLGIWQWIAGLAQNPFICPYPGEVFLKMIEQAENVTFYQQILATVARALFSFIVSYIAGIVLSMAVYKQIHILPYVEKAILMLRSIPNVTFIILFLFWMNREWTITSVSFLLLFPIVFQNSLNALQSLEEDWQDVLKIYPQKTSYKWIHIYIPLMKSSLKASAISTASLAFKVGVMAEILAQVPVGIGRSMQIAKLNVDLAGVMAWTLWLLFIVFCIDAIIKKLWKE